MEESKEMNWWYNQSDEKTEDLISRYAMPKPVKELDVVRVYNSEHAKKYVDKLPPELVDGMLESCSVIAIHEARLCAQIAVTYSNKQNRELVEGLTRAYNDFKNSNWTEETYNIVEKLLKQNEI